MDKTLLLGTYWSALVHDYQHLGVNNDFLIKTGHDLAITYSDHCPLEHHHLAASTKAWMDPDCRYFPVSFKAVSLAKDIQPKDILNARTTQSVQSLRSDCQATSWSGQFDVKTFSSIINALVMREAAAISSARGSAKQLGLLYFAPLVCAFDVN